MDFLVHNREAWNREVEKGNIWKGLWTQRL